MTQPSPADQLRAAAEVLRHPRITQTHAIPVAQWLDVAANTVDAYPELGDDHDRETCDDYACDLIGVALAVARTINDDLDQLCARTITGDTT